MYQPRHLVCITSYAHLLQHHMGKKREAEEYYMKAIQQSHDFVPALSSMGALLQELGR